jgi:hypothetical protein
VLHRYNSDINKSRHFRGLKKPCEDPIVQQKLDSPEISQHVKTVIQFFLKRPEDRSDRELKTVAQIFREIPFFKKKLVHPKYVTELIKKC